MHDEHTAPGGIASGPFVVVTKIEAARRQLATAIELCLDDRDAVSTRTLAEAAHEILRTLHRRRGGRRAGRQDNPLHDGEKMRRRMATAAALTRNFFKHAEKDPDHTLRFRPAMTELVILDAVAMQHDLDGAFSVEGRVFFAYFGTMYERDLGHDFPFASAVRRAKAAAAAEGKDVARKAFFALMLKDPDLRAGIPR